jgi:uncharacterized phage protein (TIGR02218 family)
MKVFLYQFILQAESQSLYLTNDNTSHTYGGNTYVASAIESKEFSFDLKEIMGEVPITIPWTQCGFIQAFPQQSLEGPVEVTVYRYSTVDANTTLVFRGFINSFKVSKAAVDLQCISFIEQSRDNFSRLVLTRHCNHRLYSEMCGMIPGNWSFKSTIVGIDFPRTQIIVNPPPGVASGFYQYGYAKCDTSLTYRWITGDVSSEVAVTFDIMHTAPASWALGTELWLFAGCDKTLDTCRSKFGNFSNFMGFPYAPFESIRFTGLRQSETRTSGGKK